MLAVYIVHIAGVPKHFYTVVPFKNFEKAMTPIFIYLLKNVRKAILIKNFRE